MGTEQDWEAAQSRVGGGSTEEGGGGGVLSTTPWVFRNSSNVLSPVLEARSPKSAVGRAAATEGAGEGSSRPLSWFVVVAWLWQHHSSLHKAVSLCVCPKSPFTGTC